MFSDKINRIHWYFVHTMVDQCKKLDLKNFKLFTKPCLRLFILILLSLGNKNFI